MTLIILLIYWVLQVVLQLLRVVYRVRLKPPGVRLPVPPIMRL